MSLDKRSIELGTEGWGVKEDNLLAFRKDRTRYVEKPFTFSRASEGTIVNSDGYIQYSGIGNELIVNGDFNGNADGWEVGSEWNYVDGTLQYPQSATLNNPSQQTLSTNLIAGELYKIEFDVITETTGNILFRLRQVDNGTEDVTNGYQTFSQGRQHFLYTPSEEINRVQIWGLGSSDTFALDNISIKQVKQEIPRISYDIVDGVVSDKPHLLLEPARTNGFYRSQDAWSFNYNSHVDFISNYSISPDGEKNAINVIPNTNNVIHQFASSDRGLQYTANDILTYSIFIKPNGYNYALVGGFFGDEAAIFNLSDGSVISEGTNVISAKSENYGNGWRRYIITYTYQNNIGNGYTYAGLKIYDDESLSGFAGDGVKGVLVFGIQIEEGSYATSYIPTFETSVTRAAETANNCGAVQDFNDDEGVLFVESAALADDATERRLTMSNGTVNERVLFAYDAASQDVHGFVGTAGGNFTAVVAHPSDIREFSRYAVKYKSGDYSFWINGYKVDSSNVLTAPTGINNLRLEDANGSLDFYAKLKELKVYTEALSDAELRLLTKYAPKDYDAAFTADYVDNLAEFTVLRTEATDKLYYSISDGTNSVSGSATITATQVTISNIDISSLTDGTLTLSVYIEDERKQRGVTVTDTTIKDTTNTPLYSYALQQRATGATFEDLNNSESIIESLNVEV